LGERGVDVRLFVPAVGVKTAAIAHISGRSGGTVPSLGWPDMTFDWDAHGPLYLIAGAVLLAGLIARRVPAMRVLVSVAGWVVLAGLLAVVVGQRGQFDPYLGQLAARLKLDGQEVVGREVRIRMSADGHFWARVRIGDAPPVRMLVDSGATVTALSSDTAAAAGIEARDGLVPVLLRTANGTVRAQTATVEELRFGNIVARGLPVVVSPAFGDMSVLGMNFLSRLKSWRVEGRTLILVPNHPQPEPAEV